MLSRRKEREGGKDKEKINDSMSHGGKYMDKEAAR